MPRPLATIAPWIAPAALVLALASLAANVVLLGRLRHPERMAAPALDRVLTQLEKSDARLKYSIRVPAGTPLHFDVPIDQNYVINLRTSLPINTNVKLPVATPFGRRVIEVPVRANVPLRQDIPVHLVDTFRLRTQTQTEYVIPLEVRVRDLPLADLRKSLNP